MAMKKVTVNLSDETIEDLKAVAEKRGITLTEAIRKAIATEKFVQDERDEGAKILIEKPGGRVREVEFR
ncbi:MAG: ribbon-helix-helix domain-containing protein [Actinobacteria bacterium]|nr:ribbon-helix-helix domain-containing protein [Actinomycetota bacterium]